MPYLDALYKRRDEIKTHVCYNEQGCALAAVGYARTSGKMGVYFTTSGPGAVNGLGGLADAYGIKAATLSSHEELDSYKTWFEDNEPCLIDIYLPEESLLTPKIKFETGEITPLLPKDIELYVKRILDI